MVLIFCQLVKFSEYSAQSVVSTSSVIELFLTQGYEDWVRHRGDGAINRKLVTQVDTESVNQIHVFESCFSNKILPSYGISISQTKVDKQDSNTGTNFSQKKFKLVTYF